MGYHGGKLRVSLWMDSVGCVSTQPEVSLHMDWLERKITEWRVIGDSLDGHFGE